MKNLQNFGVQELSATEQKEVDGGFAFIALCCLGYMIYNHEQFL
jgi:hypothetical protein